MNPSEAELERLWRWCGFKALDEPDALGLQLWQYPKERRQSFSLPSLDLNSLFRYAVPQVQAVRSPIRLNWWRGRSWWQADIGATIEVRDEDPALALFRAIQAVIEAEK